MHGLDWTTLRDDLPPEVGAVLAPGAPVVVTGCAGFVGSHLSEALLALDCKVVGVDSLTDYYDPQQKRDNLAGCLADPRFTFVEQDLNAVDLAARLGGARACFHLAAQAGVRASWGEEFTRYLDWNVLATQRLLEACRQPQVAGTLARLVYSSSSSVYGDQPRYPVTETDLPQPRSPYGVSKLAAEHLCLLYSESYGVPTSSLRYFTVYGPRQRPDMAFRKFLEAALDGQEFTIYGDGHQTRDFTFVADAVRANLLAVAAPRDRSGREHRRRLTGLAPGSPRPAHRGPGHGRARVRRPLAPCRDRPRRRAPHRRRLPPGRRPARLAAPRPPRTGPGPGRCLDRRPEASP
jgi:UDP-glucuronate 4-epimerase